MFSEDCREAMAFEDEEYLNETEEKFTMSQWIEMGINYQVYPEEIRKCWGI